MNRPASIPPDNRILFYRRDRPEFGFLSHIHPSAITLDGVSWPTAEHYYQAQKSLDPRYRQAIGNCMTPAEAKHRAATPAEGRPDRGSWFFETGCPPRSDWLKIKRDVMRRADAAKYLQHPDLATRLLACGNALIVEDSPHDAFWGWGKDERGENWAGRILMEVRSALRAGSLETFLDSAGKPYDYRVISP